MEEQGRGKRGGRRVGAGRKAKRSTSGKKYALQKHGDRVQVLLCCKYSKAKANRRKHASYCKDYKEALIFVNDVINSESMCLSDNIPELLKHISLTNTERLCPEIVEIIIDYVYRQRVAEVGVINAQKAQFDCNNRATLFGESSIGFVNEYLCKNISGDQIFQDVGSGLGQICLYVAAVTGCMSYGFEIIKERHDLAVLILKDYDAILERAGLGRYCVGNKVHLICGDFKNTILDPKRVNLVYACNYGPHYSSSAKTKSGLATDYNRILNEYMMRMSLGARLVCLEKIISKRDPKYDLNQSFYGDFSWLGSNSKQIPIYEYIIIK